MRKIMTCVAVAAMTAMAHAQTTNLALTNADGTGMAEAFTLTELDGADEATFQMWVNPTAWTQATLIGQDNFSIEMDATEGQIAVKAGDGTATFTVDGMVGKWTQLTVTVAGGAVKAYADNTEVAVTGSLPAQFEATATGDTQGCVIAKGLKGRMDEIRVWAGALAQEDFFWQNTLNKWNDNYDILAAYWKCDQKLEGALLDYRNMNEAGHHNASLTGITKDAVTDNAAFKYRVVTGYTSLMRFTDRPNIDRDMFLMTNDVILLSGKVQEDGSIFPEWPDNSATPTNVDYIAEWQGRKGVMEFKGAGSQMMAKDSRIPFNTVAKSGLGESTTATIEGWIYIDQWVDGAEIFSNYKDENNCIVVKLGNESEKALILDLCGTTATLKGKLDTDKWQYVAVYLYPTPGAAGDYMWEPVGMSIGETDNSGNFVSTQYSSFDPVGTAPIEIGGKEMTISSVPVITDGILTIGKNFCGKMDELMVWGSGRSTNITNDATKPYEWNVGNWNNIFLCAYYKGDDPDNIGHDSQSLLAITDYLRNNYYTNCDGYKIRLGLISSLPEEGWHNVLDKEENVDRFIHDAKEIVKHFDGLDVDLEWMNNQAQWNMYNGIVKRLINEVMADYPEKVFSCSLHGWCHKGFDLNLLDEVDYFTMQIYDWPLDYDTYVDNAYNSFHSYGYPDDKLTMSYATIMDYADNGGYKDLFEKHGMNDDNFDPDLNSWTSASGTTYNFNGVNLVKKKQQFIIDKDLNGTMYFDMGNDLKVSDYKSLIRAQNEVISANVDTVMTVINMTPSGVRPIAARTGEELFTAVQDGDNINVTLADAATPATLAVYSVDGRAMMQMPLQGKQTAVPADGLGRGIYLLRVTQGSESHSVKIAIR